MTKRTVDEFDVAGKRVLVRVDFNIPLSSDGAVVLDDSRIITALPTINYLLDKGAAVILCSHLGRPKGRVVEELRMAPVRQCLFMRLGLPVIDADGPTGTQTTETVARLRPGEVALLENLRFDPREEANDPRFAAELASLADFYVNDAFGAAHRVHASIVGVTAFLPSAAGFLLDREVKMLGKVMHSAQHPVLAIIGGAKVSDKISVLASLAERVDAILIGGAMVGSFAAASGLSCGNALTIAQDVAAARDLLRRMERRVRIPTDVVTGDRFAPDAEPEVCPIGAVPENRLILDIGPDTRRRYEAEIAAARTVLWNGPVGVVEWQAFSAGTFAIAKAIAANRDAATIVGGGSTAEVVRSLGLAGEFTHVSTGGGASLEFLEGKTLPGLAALPDAARDVGERVLSRERDPLR